ncbi:Olfactory receptor 52K1, partial [Galemys pyrenaicus]
MPPLNTSHPSPVTFLLVGIPGLEHLHVWIGIPFCSMYLLATVGNVTILAVVRAERSLHEPMFLFLCMLSVTDLVLSTSTLPRMLCLFWFGARDIALDACLTQMFFIHSFTAMESGFFLAMAIDRYVAICHPLRHTTILTHARICIMGILVVIRGVVFFSPHPILLKQLPYCRSRIIAHTYCEFMAVVKLACKDVGATKSYSLSMASIIGSCDAILIAVSYAFILRSVFRLPSREASFKALGTCGSHDDAITTANIMLTCNRTNLQPTIFLLIGIPGLEAAHIWISIPFCLVYLLSVMGNIVLLLIIKTDHQLHEPMYLFLCMLSVVDLMLTSSTLPKILSLFWFNDREIYFEACLTQMYLVHSLSTMESGFILAMAFDRYIAICHPLRHSTVLTPAVIVGLGLVVVFRGAILLSPHPFLLRWLSYCRTNVISHTYCEFMALIKLVCTETKIRKAYSLIVAFLTGGLDFILIICSYALILLTVFNLPSKAARLKTLSTCVSHVFGHHIAPHVHIIIANIYLLIPPMMNPIIY